MLSGREGFLCPHYSFATKAKREVAITNPVSRRIIVSILVSFIVMLALNSDKYSAC